jgi:RNA polymerase sigma-70 factor (ECF subfamily)
MNTADELVPTRQSLLSRLKDWNDQESWKVFFDTYWRLIYSAAIKAGLSDAEAQDVVQETVIGVLKKLPDFDYDPRKGSFKNWLLRLTSWRISDCQRGRHRAPREVREPKRRDTHTGTRTETIAQVPDPASAKWMASWEEEWERNQAEAAIERVKKKVDPKHYQIFDLHVFKGWSVARICRMMRVNPGRVYIIKHRINSMIKKEVANLQANPM